ncbi:MAG: helix-turn-helix domain-containing protein [Planctomycetaceae bacterium]|nr:helix-turn-helix domain-containing protein [Planctomycetaceae bacterium]
MGKMPEELRRTIARNIRAEREKKYPGRGGSKRCAQEFGVLPQQWSPWERGRRTPDEIRLQDIADFFGTTVEYLRCDHEPRPVAEPETGKAVTETQSQSFPHLPIAESEIIWQLHRVFSSVDLDGRRLSLSLNMVFSKECGAGL